VGVEEEVVVGVLALRVEEEVAEIIE